MRLKSRRLKLKSQKTTNKKAIIIVAIIAVLVVVILVAVFAVVRPTIEQNGKEIKNISITKIPDKQIYYIGEDVSYDGIEITVTLNNGQQYTVPKEKCQFFGFDSSKKTNFCYITVKYKDYSTQFSVVIKEAPTATSLPVRITLETLPKTEYKVGEKLSASGGVILCEYDDGSTFRISLANNFIYGFEKVDGPGEYTLVVKYKEAGFTLETTYTITVTK